MAKVVKSTNGRTVVCVALKDGGLYYATHLINVGDSNGADNQDAGGDVVALRCFRSLRGALAFAERAVAA